MGFMFGKKVIPILLPAMILFSATSYAGQSEEEIVVDLGNITIEQGAPLGGELGGELMPKVQVIANADEGVEDPPKAEAGAEAQRETKADTAEKEQSQSTAQTEVSYGMFEVTGYCPCEICTGNNHLTYSETVPKAKHTVAADLRIFPLGTKLKIDGTIYTVEDIGAAIKNNKIDIFYDDHQEALESGRRYIEVFRIQDKK